MVLAICTAVGSFDVVHSATTRNVFVDFFVRYRATRPGDVRAVVNMGVLSIYPLP